MKRIKGQEQSCGNCAAFEPNKASNPKSGETRPGLCCAKPPVPATITMQVPGGLATGGQPQLTQAVQGMFPPVKSDNWCREWQRNEEA